MSKEDFKKQIESFELLSYEKVKARIESFCIEYKEKSLSKINGLTCQVDYLSELLGFSKDENFTLPDMNSDLAIKYIAHLAKLAGFVTSKYSLLSLVSEILSKRSSSDETPESFLKKIMNSNDPDFVSLEGWFPQIYFTLHLRFLLMLYFRLVNNLLTPPTLLSGSLRNIVQEKLEKEILITANAFRIYRLYSNIVNSPDSEELIIYWLDTFLISATQYFKKMQPRDELIFPCGFKGHVMYLAFCLLYDQTVLLRIDNVGMAISLDRLRNGNKEVAHIPHAQIPVQKLAENKELKLYLKKICQSRYTKLTSAEAVELFYNIDRFDRPVIPLPPVKEKKIEFPQVEKDPKSHCIVVNFNVGILARLSGTSKLHNEVGVYKYVYQSLLAHEVRFATEFWQDDPINFLDIIDKSIEDYENKNNDLIKTMQEIKERQPSSAPMPENILQVALFRDPFNFALNSRNLRSDEYSSNTSSVGAAQLESYQRDVRQEMSRECSSSRLLQSGRIYFASSCPAGNQGVWPIQDNYSAFLKNPENQFRKIYTPRGSLESKISRALEVDKIIVVEGLAGAGKHFLVYSYTLDTFFNKYYTIIWFQNLHEFNNDMKRLRADYQQFFKKIDFAQTLHALVGTIPDSKTGLIILNCQYSDYETSCANIRAYLPLEKFKLILISRIHQSSGLRRISTVEVDAMEQKEAEDLLTKGVQVLNEPEQVINLAPEAISMIVSLCFFYPLPIYQFLNYLKSHPEYKPSQDDLLQMMNQYYLTLNPAKNVNNFSYLLFETLKQASRAINSGQNKKRKLKNSNCFFNWFTQRKLSSAALTDEIIEDFYKEKNSKSGKKIDTAQTQRHLNVVQQFFLCRQNGDKYQQMKEVVLNVLPHYVPGH
jgi:hypothetical protein